MSTYSFHNNSNDERKDKLKSGIITAIIWTALLMFVFMYKITERIPEKKELVTKMLINFGDNRNGSGEEEPANQEGSLASNQEVAETQPVAENIVETQPNIVAQPIKKESKEKIITGTNNKVSVPKTETVKKSTDNSTKKPVAAATKTTSKSTTANSTTGSGDGKGAAALGNLIKGRGTKAGTQGNNGTIGNAGDPLGGDGNGDSKIGVDRKLIGFIPGTMGRGGAQPTHNCKASGTIQVAYTVDKAGNVISANRSSGVSDPCVVSTSVSWVKKYVKAEKANSSSTGTYKITF